MGTDQYVDLSLCEVGENLLRLLAGACAREIFHPHGEVGQTAAEGVEMLVGEHRGGHEHGHLLAVGGGLEGCAHGYLGLSETHIAANKAVHRARAFHILFHGVCGRSLVGSVLVDE